MLDGRPPSHYHLHFCIGKCLFGKVDSRVVKIKKPPGITKRLVTFSGQGFLLENVPQEEAVPPSLRADGPPLLALSVEPCSEDRQLLGDPRGQGPSS